MQFDLSWCRVRVGRGRRRGRQRGCSGGEKRSARRRRHAQSLRVRRRRRYRWGCSHGSRRYQWLCTSHHRPMSNAESTHGSHDKATVTEDHNLSLVDKRQGLTQPTISSITGAPADHKSCFCTPTASSIYLCAVDGHAVDGKSHG